MLGECRRFGLAEAALYIGKDRKPADLPALNITFGFHHVIILSVFLVFTMHITAFLTASALALATTSVASPVPELEPRVFENFRKQMLDAQNWYRDQHGAAPLTWNDNLAQNAKNWASKCSTDPRHQVRNGPVLVIDSRAKQFFPST